MPQYINKLDTYASSILDLSNNFPDTKEEIIDEVSKCSTDFKTISKKTPRILRKEIKKIEAQISNILFYDLASREQARNVYRKILSVSQSLQNFLEEYQMER